MNSPRHYTVAMHLCALLSLVVVSTGCGGAEGRMSAEGTVSLDGEPLSSGTVHFESVNLDPPCRTGTGVDNGRFEIPAKVGLQPGEYRVSVQGFRKTGKTFQDPQRGPVEETEPIPIRDNVIDVTISPENAQELEIAVHSGR